jgi:hypothetical protein
MLNEVEADLPKEIGDDNCLGLASHHSHCAGGRSGMAPAQSQDHTASRATADLLRIYDLGSGLSAVRRQMSRVTPMRTAARKFVDVLLFLVASDIIVCT